MKTLIVYFSKLGNTQKVAETIADTLMQAGDARAISVDELTASALREADFLIVGSPTHSWNMPNAVQEFLSKMSYRSLVGKSVAVFDTSMKVWEPMMFLTASHRLVLVLRILGGKPLVRPKTFLVEKKATAMGRVNLRAGEIELAKAWANFLLKRLEQTL